MRALYVRAIVRFCLFKLEHVVFQTDPKQVCGEAVGMVFLASVLKGKQIKDNVNSLETPSSTLK